MAGLRAQFAQRRHGLGTTSDDKRVAQAFSELIQRAIGDGEIAEKGEATGTCHAHYQVEFACRKTPDELCCFTVVIQRAFLDGGSHERLALLPGG